MAIDKSFFGHPRGLATLFFTEMWERFSYYGMRALLILFMVAAVEEGGMGLDEKTAGAIYGLYTMSVYLLALPGGWLADKFFGLRKSIFYGGCIIALGHFFLVFQMTETFLIGLLLIAIGTGMLKPTVSSMVGELYSTDEGVRRDAGFTLFYMGINIGGFLSPLVTGFLGDINWHLGFASAGIGMVLGVIYYKLTEKNLGDAGVVPENADRSGHRKILIGLWVIGTLVAVVVTLLVMRIIVFDPRVIANYTGYILAACAALYFIYILVVAPIDRAAKMKIVAIAIFFSTSALFYSGYEQQGSSLNLFAKRYTDLFIGSYEMPAAWFQSVPSIVVILFAPLFTLLWFWFAKRNINVSVPVKIALGPLFTSLGFAVVMGGSIVFLHGEKAAPWWLIATFTLHTFGEICLYPVGMSAVTKLAPKAYLGQMMGIWFMSLALGNLVAGLYAGEFDQDAIAANPQMLVDIFWYMVKVMGIPGLIILIFARPIRKLMGNVT